MRLRTGPASRARMVYPRVGVTELPPLPAVDSDDVAEYEAAATDYADEHAARLGLDPEQVAIAVYGALTAHLFRRGELGTRSERWGQYTPITFRDSAAARDLLRRRYRPAEETARLDEWERNKLAAECKVLRATQSAPDPAPF